MAEHIVRSFDGDIDRIVTMIVEMGGRAEAQVEGALAALARGDGAVADAVVDADAGLDLAAEAIDQTAVWLFARRQPMAVDLRLIAMSLKISNDLERVGDYAANVAKRAKRLAAGGEFGHASSLLRMGELVRDMLTDVVDAYADRDARLAMTVWHRDAEVDGLYRTLFRELVDGARDAPAATSTRIDLLFVAKNLERLGDHATNIAERVHYIVHGDRINRTRSEPVHVAAGD
jgi:phosphate transport system protein